MSNIYITEPPTSGKVLLVTSVGDIDIELWSRETPLACRNFIQLCMEGYYNGTLFHRVVPDFIVQGGDPEGTGHGGVSIYDKPFKDEFHSRIRFNRRGLVAMANSGPNDNGSQFFFTLAATPELGKKHTIFGKVAGDTVYNMVKLGDVETDENERPLYPHKIIRTEVVINPFDDIIPRELAHRNEGAGEGAKSKESQSRATKNFKLLSFGEEAEDDEGELMTVGRGSKSKSSHDLLEDRTLSSKASREEPAEVKDSTSAVERIQNKLKRSVEDGEIDVNDDVGRKKKVARWQEHEDKVKSSKSDKKSDSFDSKHKNKHVDEIEKLKNSLLPPVVPRTKKSAADREAETLALLAKFKSKLGDAQNSEELRETKEDRGEEEEAGWMSHRLECEDHSQKVKDANVAELDRYEIFDPRNPITQRRREESKKTMNEKKSKR